MDKFNKRIVLCSGLRTPIGHLAKTLSGVYPEDLMAALFQELLKKTGIDHACVDGVLIGWVGQGSHAPNISRIVALKSGLPDHVHAVTLQANCISSLETVCSAARRILAGEGQLYLAGGVETMSIFPYAIRGPRSAKALRSLQNIKENWSELWNEPDVFISDTMEEGLNDPIKKINMAATAEVCAQKFGITRQEQDAFAHETFMRCLNAQQKGFYSTHVVPYSPGGKTLIDKDEYVFLRKSLAENSEHIKKAPPLFHNSTMPFSEFFSKYKEHIGKDYTADAQPTVTLFNSCARSDGAAALIVTTLETARKWGLDILGELKSWSFQGINPAHMGLAPIEATHLALKTANLQFGQLDQIELHEAFAATCLSIFKMGKAMLGHDWETAWREKKVNPNGGSIALGHPLATTGARVLLNLLYALKDNPQSRYGLATACASGGLGGALIVEKV